MPILDANLSVPRNMSQEWVSIAVVRALCAQAGLNVSTWEWDDGLDLTVGSAKANYCGFSVRNIKFHLQLKSTKNWEVKDGQISFSISVQKYNQLAGESWDPQHLVLYTLPLNRARWVQSRHDHSAFSHCAYFLSFDRLKPLKTEHVTHTLHVPAANRLTAGELIRMYRDAGQRTRGRR